MLEKVPSKQGFFHYCCKGKMDVRDERIIWGATNIVVRRKGVIVPCGGL